MKTFLAKAENVERKWYVIDADGATLGRLATKVATVLKGKHKPTYTPNVDTGDHVIVINTDKIVLTGKKLEKKMINYEIRKTAPQLNFTSNTGIRLPPNLSLLATMNTSDQNVFTLDNAFQRRWDMKLVPNTLEGCVVRISDIISYLGKDRQDAEKLARHNEYEDTAIGTFNAAIINNLIVNIIENSYGKDFIAMDDEHFLALSLAKKENYDKIYLTNNLDPIVRPMMEKIYERLLNDVVTNNLESPIFTHHIELVENSYYRKGKSLYRDETEPNQLVVDYIASMTDDYFIDLYTYFFGATPIEFKGYFD